MSSLQSNHKTFCKTSRALNPLELIHLEICEPMNAKEFHGAIYFITVIDDYSQYGYVCLLPHHYEALDVVKRFVA